MWSACIGEASHLDMRPITRMGRMSGVYGALALLDDAVATVARDLEDREADAADHVAELVERDRLAEQRGLQLDVADVAANLAAARLAVGTRVRDPHRDRLHRDPRGGPERVRLPVLLLEGSGVRLRDRDVVDVEAERRDVRARHRELGRDERPVGAEESA